MGASRTTAPTLAELRRTTLYSEELGIRLARRSDRECFKWFLASLLFGGRISESIARNTYRSFARERLLTPRAILAAGWDYLVDPVMRHGGYVRYDESKSRQILRDCETLLDRYGGSLVRLHREAADAADLEVRIEAFFGVGPVTANIFLRELRPFWSKADPEPLPAVRDGARRARIDLAAFDRHTLTFTRIEAGLVRRRHREKPAARRPVRASVSPRRAAGR